MEDEKLDINMVAMNVILNAGDGRVLVDKALDCMAAFDFDGAENLYGAEKKLDEADA